MLVPIPSLIPAFLFPLRLVVGCVQCDCCLRIFYRVRLRVWKIRRSDEEQFALCGQQFGASRTLQR